MAVAERTKPRVVIRQGHVWMTHREYAAVERWDRAPACDGTLRFVHVNGIHKELECDACRYFVAATVTAIRTALDELDKLEEIAAWRRGQWWND